MYIAASLYGFSSKMNRYSGILEDGWMEVEECICWGE